MPEKVTFPSLEAMQVNSTGIGDCEMPTRADIKLAAWTLITACHGQSYRMGWWDTPAVAFGKDDIRENPMAFSQKLMLTVSELAEAMEGDRKALGDEHIPGMDSREVEIADAVIRLFDMAGGFSLRLGVAIAEKLAYNLNRADHQKAARAADGGKAY